MRHWLELADGPWALPAVVLAFAVLAFLGAPQIVLIAAAVAAFGPWRGMAYSWTGTMVSALVGFGIGRRFGSRLLGRMAGEPMARFMVMVARNGVLASLVVRLVPFAPFIIVNMAAGATPIGALSFAAGTAIGILPKIALTALAGHTLVKAIDGGGVWPIVLLGAAVAMWIVAGLIARRWTRR